MTTFKARLHNGKPLIGSLVTLTSTDVAEIMALVGFDYLWIETEHAPTDFFHAQKLIQAVGGRCPCLIRVPENKEVWFKKALDIGCDGVVVPQIRTADDARAVVKCCLYPPEGERSVGVSRAHRYGMAFQDYVKSVNDDLVIVLQIEHIETVKNVEAIAAVPGIDALLIGPYDLSGSLNVLGEIDHPEVQSAIERVRAHGQRTHLPLGIFAVDAQAAREALAQGFNLIALSMDAAFLWQAAQEALNQVKGQPISAKN